MSGGFFIRQINDICNGGIFLFLKKVLKLLLVVLAIPAIIIVRLLRPFILLRFGQVPSGRIGPFVTLPELYLCERNSGNNNNRVFDFFFYNGPISNYQVKKMWERILYISNFVNPIFSANRLFPGYKKHIVEMHNNNENDYNGLLATHPVNIFFTEKERRFGQENLQLRGISSNDKFICLSCRDSAYLAKTFPKNDWSYHNHRDFSIYDCVQASEELAKRGYFVLRMGALTKETLNTNNPKILDYANIFRDDFLDIYLFGSCYFSLGSNSGINSVAMVFRRPRAIVNAIPISDVQTWVSDDLFILKKLWLRKERRFMTFREIFETGVARFRRAEQYNQFGIDVVDNKPEEITALAVEMDERLKGTWRTNEEDEELQGRFWTIFKTYELHGVIRSRIGTEFLRQNKDLLR